MSAIHLAAMQFLVNGRQSPPSLVDADLEDDLAHGPQPAPLGRRIAHLLALVFGVDLFHAADALARMQCFDGFLVLRMSSGRFFSEFL